MTSTSSKSGASRGQHLQGRLAVMSHQAGQSPFVHQGGEQPADIPVIIHNEYLICDLLHISSGFSEAGEADRSP